MEQFNGKTAVVTGAGSGIGRALATRCAGEGMRVALADVHEGRLNDLRTKLEGEGAQVLACTLDVSDAAAVSAFARQCCAELDVPDLLFNNAGILRIGEAWSHSPEDWQIILSINVLGVVHGLNAFVPPMLEAGKKAHIVNTGSVGSLVAAPAMAQYTAAKMAVRGITETLAHDLAAREALIDVSLLCPGPVLTSISDDLLGVEASSEEVDPADHLMVGQPDFITPEECADRVFRAIRERRFWIFTHPFNQYISDNTQAIVTGENPVYREVAFD
ncbi:MAG: SDR family NAD(P)-dependent oxidoreductase [Halieaceae bacterium]|nr:SDR family NAD(P)-dependent oxidoreductase [Halieaceae bacterium]